MKRISLCPSFCLCLPLDPPQSAYSSLASFSSAVTWVEWFPNRFKLIISSLSLSLHLSTLQLYRSKLPPRLQGMSDEELMARVYEDIMTLTQPSLPESTASLDGSARQSVIVMSSAPQTPTSRPLTRQSRLATPGTSQTPTSDPSRLPMSGRQTPVKLDPVGIKLRLKTLKLAAGDLKKMIECYPANPLPNRALIRALLRTRGPLRSLVEGDAMQSLLNSVKNQPSVFENDRVLYERIAGIRQQMYERRRQLGLPLNYLDRPKRRRLTLTDNQQMPEPKITDEMEAQAAAAALRRQEAIRAYQEENEKRDAQVSGIARQRLRDARYRQFRHLRNFIEADLHDEEGATPMTGAETKEG